MLSWLQFAAAWLVLKFFGLLPRPVARAAGHAFAALGYILRPPLRRAAHTNLLLAFPDWSHAQRRRTLRRLIRNVGWMAGEFSQFPRYNRRRIESVVIHDGYENFAAAEARGKGVLFLTGHMGAWELAPFAHALYGRPLHFLIRPLENSRIESLINRYRCLSGNQPIDKNQSAREVLRVLRSGGTVGILIDQNTPVSQGVFVPFFGVPASTTTGLARFALHTDAAVVPGYIYWDEAMRKYRLRFDPAIPVSRTGDEQRDIVENTARFTRVVEDYARRFPDQWLWVHKRWRTRPPGEKDLYSS